MSKSYKRGIKMSRFIRLALMAITALLTVVAGAPGNRVTADSTPRLVVFEGFLQPG
jgi:hypothetical protein